MVLYSNCTVLGCHRRLWFCFKRMLLLKEHVVPIKYQKTISTAESRWSCDDCVLLPLFTVFLRRQSWWNRMSNRFRKLKLTHTLRHGLSTNRLAPFPDEVPLDATMKAEESSAAAAPPAGAPNADVCTAWSSKSKDCGAWSCSNSSRDVRASDAHFPQVDIIL